MNAVGPGTIREVVGKIPPVDVVGITGAPGTGLLDGRKKGGFIGHFGPSRGNSLALHLGGIHENPGRFHPGVAKPVERVAVIGEMTQVITQLGRSRAVGGSTEGDGFLGPPFAAKPTQDETQNQQDSLR